MGPGTLDPLTKELLYVAVSASNGCLYCIASHGAAARSKGMTEAQYSELLAIVGLANETNRLVTRTRRGDRPAVFLTEDQSWPRTSTA